jgi:MFS family permease
MLLGGAVTDRFSPRRVLITTAVVRTLLVGTVAALIGLHAIRLWELYLLTFAFGVADAFSAPAGPALIPTLVQAEQLPPANALLQSSTVAAQMVGPAPAGFLIKRWGIATALFLDALSFLGVIVALWRLPDPPQAPPSADAPPRPSMLHSIGEGLRTVRQDPALLSLMMVNAVLNICVAGPLAVGLAVLAKFRFGSAAAFGTFLSSFSAGFLAGILLGGMWKRPRRRGLQFIAVCALAGVELIAIGLVL